MTKNNLFHSKNYFIIIFIITIQITLFSKITFADEKSTNDSYYSNLYFNSYYYNQLNDVSKSIYDALLDNIDKTKSGIKSIKINFSNYNTPITEDFNYFQAAIDAFDRDHPEVFWIDINKLEFKYSTKRIDNIDYLGNVIITYADEYDNYLIDEYSNSKEVNDDINRISSFIAEQMPYISSYSDENTTYKQVKYIHDLLIQINDYNSNISIASTKASKVIGALPGNKDGIDAPICEGYARAFKVLCDKAGIGCVIVSGQGITSTNSVSHMWNYVLLNGSWYAIDVTWDDPIIKSGSYSDLTQEQKYAYFLLGSSTFNFTHHEINCFVQKENYFYQFIYPIIQYDNLSIIEDFYSISFADIHGGIIKTNLKDNENVSPGTIVKLTMIANEGMKFKYGSLIINDEEYYATSFVMPDENVFIDALFVDDIAVNKENDKTQPTSKPTFNNSNTNTPSDNPSKDSSDTTTSTNIDNTTTSNNSNNLQNNTTNIVDIDIENEDDLFPEIEENTSNTINVSINNYTNLNFNEKNIKFRYSKDAFYEDAQISFYNTFYDNNDITQIINTQSINEIYYSHFNAFTIKMHKSSNNKLLYMEDGKYLSIMLPLENEYYNYDKKITLYSISNSVLKEYEYKIITYKKVRYVYFKLYQPVNSFVLVYNSNEKYVDINSTSYSAPSQNIEVEIAPKTIKDTNTTIYYLLLVAIGCLVFTLAFILLFNTYMNYTNKKIIKIK